MSKFLEIKKQLEEIAPLVNSFKSEAVQLRVLEILLDGSPITFDESSSPGIAKKPKTNSQSMVRKNDISTKKSGKKARGDGARAILDQLVVGHFFSTPRTISAIIHHCDQHMARKFKQNEFSGKLARLTRSGALKRTKNKDGQYEYKK